MIEILNWIAEHPMTALYIGIFLLIALYFVCQTINYVGQTWARNRKS